MEYEAGKLYWNGTVREYYICEKVDGDVVQFKSLRQNGYMDRSVGFVSDAEKDFRESEPEALDKRIDKIDQRVQDIQTDLVQEKKYLASLKGHRARRLKAEQEKLQAEETVMKEASNGLWWHGNPVTRGGPWDGINASRRDEGASISDKEAYKILTTPVTVGLDWKPVGKSDEETKVIINNFTGRGFDTTQRYDITVTLDSNATPQDIVDAISEKMIRAVSIDETSCGADGCTGCEEELINEQVRIAEADGKPEPGHIIFDPSVWGATDG